MVTIKVKSPSASYQDLEFECELDETVLNVKTRISQEFPTNPSVSSQKLVYSGKILKDEDKLENVLRFDDEVTKFTFHLVCALPQKKNPVPEPVEPFPDGVRHRHNTNVTHDNDMDQMMREFSNQYSEAMASMSSNPSEEDMAAMQQLYNQYLSLYMQYLQNQSHFAPQQPQWELQQPGGHLDNVQDAGDAAGPNNPGLVMNAGAAAGQLQEVAGDRQRDFLDWVYVMSRVMLLVSVIYFHSSFLRLAFVAGLGFAVYLYQNRVRNQQQRLQQQQQQQQREQQQREQQQRNNTEEPRDENSNTAGDETDEDVLVETEPVPSKFAVFVTFMTSLVSSIIPEQPQVI